MEGKRLHHVEITANSFSNCSTPYTMPFKLGSIVEKKTMIKMSTINNEAILTVDKIVPGNQHTRLPHFREWG